MTNKDKRLKYKKEGKHKREMEIKKERWEGDERKTELTLKK